MGAKPAETEGTARVLKRFRSYIKVSSLMLRPGQELTIKTDFVLLPCDLYPPAYLSLSSILDKHRSSPSAVLTSVLYDPPEVIRERKFRQTTDLTIDEEALLSAYDRRSSELLMLQNMDNLDEDFEIRSALLEA